LQKSCAAVHSALACSRVSRPRTGSDAVRLHHRERHVFGSTLGVLTWGARCAALQWTCSENWRIGQAGPLRERVLCKR
jgi:hypothetical protein